MYLETFLGYIKRGKVPPEPPDGLDEHGGTLFPRDWEARRFCIERGMWAVVSRDWVEELADWIGDRNVLEIMAGAGWLAEALHDSGSVKVIATDNGDWDDKHSKMKAIYPIQKLEASEAMRKHGNWADILIVSWPPYDEEAICHACDLWGSEKPIVYIGESYGGCNAPEEFFERFREDGGAPSIPLMSWSGLHDHVFIGKYVKEE